MRDVAATPTETEFVTGLRRRVPALQDWYHADADGTLWVTVSYDDEVDGELRATWRLDFDGVELVAGRSPAFLNWDDGVRGRETGMILDPPDGLTARPASVSEAVEIASEWFSAVTQGRATTR